MLFRSPQTAVRVRFATNEPTPWPPELPAGENPPPGAILDYYLPRDVSGTVSLQIIDVAGHVVRSYSSDDRPPQPDAGIDPTAYNTVCQQTPNAPHCAFPLYWAAPTPSISTKAGMHRFSWDMHYDPIVSEGVAPGEPETGAVPHRTYLSVNSPWAAPGGYTVRLSADGRSVTQPITVRLDPRVRATAAGLAQLATLTKEMYAGAVSLHTDYMDARALVVALQNLPGADLVAFRAQVESLAPAPARGARAGRGGGFGRGGGPAAPPTLESASAAMLSAAMAMQDAEATPTSTQVAAAEKARMMGAGVTKSWTALSTGGLAALNARRKAAGLPTVTFRK